MPLLLQYQIIRRQMGEQLPIRLRKEIQALLRRGDGELSALWLGSSDGEWEEVAGRLKFEQDLSKESVSRRAIFEEKTEESAVRTIESKGFLQTSPLPLGYRAPRE